MFGTVMSLAGLVSQVSNDSILAVLESIIALVLFVSASVEREELTHEGALDALSQ